LVVGFLLLGPRPPVWGGSALLKEARLPTLKAALTRVRAAFSAHPTVQNNSSL
jgi:hypothetical protein